MAMKLVKQLPLSEGGSCAKCDSEYTPLTGVRCLCQYWETNGNNKYPITEPFNLCKDCFEKLKEGEL